MGKYADMAQAIGDLTEQKNEAYGDSFDKAGEVLEKLYPNGIRPEQYRDALGAVRVIDKLFRIATRKDAFGESPWRDIAGYGILGAVADSKDVVDELTVEAERLGMYPTEFEAEFVEFKIGDTVNAEGWDGVDHDGEIAYIDEGCTEGLPYGVKFYDGTYRWFAAKDLERV